VYEPALPSTNTLARTLARAGATDGTVVLTDDQTAGRGRLGRTWVVPPCSGLTVSALLRLSSTFPLYTLTPAAALAVADVAGAVVGPRCTLKWPNDVLVEGAKVAGILIEVDALADGWTAVVGIGLNVNAAPPLATATCLARAAGQSLAREPLLLDLLSALDERLCLAAQDPDVLMGLWRARLVTLGRRVRVTVPDGTLEGLALDVDAEGSLIVRLDDGTRRTVRAGDVASAASGPHE
jgi:BirA family biotin operon repressor/biotin-[acetyl-CoA-carboxylase] ligase